MKFGFAALLLAGAAIAGPALAQDDEDQPTNVDELIIYGRAENQIGRVVAASEGAIAGADIDVRPLLRTGEILETVPGMIVTQHSGTGKANQYYLRGFNLDHGTDFGLSIDGVPMNFRSHGHGPGYLDVGGLIPEVVSRVDYRKGPYRADVGDFNLVGGATITTHNSFDAPFVQGQLGGYGYQRLVAGGSFDALGGTVLLAGEARGYDGPWSLPEDGRLFNLYAKHTYDGPETTYQTSLSVYSADWRPTEQIPDRAIGTLVPDAFGSIDPGLVGSTEREILTFRFDNPRWRGGLYAQNYYWSLLSNFTFFLEDPVNGDQLEQTNKQQTYGGHVQRLIEPSESLSVMIGGDFRYDDIERVGLYKTVGGARVAPTTVAAVDEASAALYGEATWRPTDRLTFFGGLRGETINYEVTNIAGAAPTGMSAASGLYPKLGVSFEAAPGIALYANYGQGFHSSDARGVNDPVDPAPGMVRGEGREVGARFERGNAVLTANYWWMDVDSELIYVGDSGSVEPSNPSERHGIELTAFWRPINGLAIDAVYTQSDARFVNSPGADRVPGAIESSAEVGFSYIRENWNIAGRYRFLGEHPLVEDGSIYSDTTTLVNLRGAWTPGDFELFAEILNVFDSDDKDVEYVYESYLPAIDLSGPVEGLHSRAVEPRTIRVGVKKTFGG